MAEKESLRDEYYIIPVMEAGQSQDRMKNYENEMSHRISFSSGGGVETE